MRKGNLISELLCAMIFAGAACCAEAENSDEAKAREAFLAEYEKGTAAAVEKSWAEAEKHFERALKALKEFSHPKKAAAQVLLTKSRENLKSDMKEQAALESADALLKLKQWPEAEAAYHNAALSLGETERTRNGIAAAQAGAKAEKEAAVQAAVALAEAKKIEADAQAAKARAQSEPERKSAPKTEGVAKIDAPAELPTAIALDRSEWQKGAGSSCYWAGERLYLEEGDEFFKKVLKRDFAVSVLLEARMDEQSLISLELRPEKDSGSKTRIIGWGSKQGSAPMLAVDQAVKSTGAARPPAEQITLSFVRRDRTIEFYCNGERVGSTMDSKQNQAYVLWVCGKGILDGAHVIEK